MANEHLILCGHLCDLALPTGAPEAVRLRIRGPGRNVYLRIEDLQRSMYKDVPDSLLDLIDIAAYVYCADQVIPRFRTLASEDKKNAEIGSEWRRTLRFRIPVRQPARWRRRELLNELIATLTFLSDDTYESEFEQATDAQNLRGQIDFGTTAFDGIIEEVVMFSGGLDSLAGAIRESVIDRRRVLLVNHRSSPKLSNRHRRLLFLLDQKAGIHRPMHLPVRVNKAKDLTHDYTQRSRSFLFATLGMTIATMIGLRRLRFYENGVVSLNLPLSPQVVGGRATRTTHPRTLAGFARLFSLLADAPFAVENPFLWKTKSDVARLIADAGCGEMIGWSTSCTHIWQISKDETHCGLCSQCVDRRFAVLSAGQRDHDPADKYGADLIMGDRADGDSKLLLAAYLESADRIDRMSALEFCSRYGEIARVVRHLPESPDEAARKIFDLHKHHARQIKGVLEDVLREHVKGIRQRTLPPTCLVRMVSDSSSHAFAADQEETEKETTGQPVASHIFRRRGVAAWEYRFAEGEFVILLAGKGAAYLHMLLSSPRQPLSAVDMACRVAKHKERYALGDAGEKTDHEALSTYRARLIELNEELDEARENHDFGHQERLQEEIEQLAAEIKTAKGLGGRLRKDSNDRERVRKAVGGALKRVRDEIAKDSPSFAEHLKASIQGGKNPCFWPADDIKWETEI
ncbi:hypothetical protein [Zavarzinella formosa]|uniref:hypothetical protein n=1 Tax=Zavarzinella formosa TaxID=360055 RepID=UPI0003676BFC|nr:hypothetical protein [Zavarzinella formosa]